MKTENSLVDPFLRKNETLARQMRSLEPKLSSKALDRLDGCPGRSYLSLGANVILCVLSRSA